MSQKIYKVFLAKQFRESWYQLSTEEQKDLMARVNEALETVGGKRIILCEANWANDRLVAFGVEEFPDVEAVQKFTQLLNEIDWFRYLDSDTVLGTEWQLE